MRQARTGGFGRDWTSARGHDAAADRPALSGPVAVPNHWASGRHPPALGWRPLSRLVSSKGRAALQAARYHLGPRRNACHSRGDEPAVDAAEPQFYNSAAQALPPPGEGQDEGGEGAGGSIGMFGCLPRQVVDPSARRRGGGLVQTPAAKVAGRGASHPAPSARRSYRAAHVKKLAAAAPCDRPGGMRESRRDRGKHPDVPLPRQRHASPLPQPARWRSSRRSRRPGRSVEHGSPPAPRQAGRRRRKKEMTMPCSNGS
jgi:hypothetical protein